jgi:hypothetical protein
MIDASVTPSSFQSLLNKVLITDLKPFRDELATLPELDAQARNVADLQEVRRIKQREVELHEALLSAAADGKIAVRSFKDKLDLLAEAERQRMDDELAAKKAARSALQTEYEKRATELDQDIVQAEQSRNAGLSGSQAISQMYMNANAELAEQIDASLKFA